MAQPSPTWRRVPDDRGVASRLGGTRFSDVRWFEEIDSTNRYLLDEAAGGAPEGLVAVADVQTAGRGRLGRRWEAPPGASLLVSVLLRPALPADAWHWLTVAAGLAAVEAVEHLAGIEARLKWPNDVVVGERKLAGLLAETEPSGGLVVGMGCNVAWQRFPAELEAIATSCSLESSTPVTAPELLVDWLLRYDARLDDLAGETGIDKLRADGAARSATLGERVRVVLAARSLDGVAEGLSPLGFLEVRRDDGTVETIAAGDVIHLRPA